MIDFAAVRSAHRIELVAQDLGLTLIEKNGKYRTECKVCGGGPRSLVITPASGDDPGLFFCVTSKRGGDLIGLYGHVNKCSMKEAAIALTPKEAPKEEPKAEPKKEGFDVEKYRAGLKTEHELLTQSGIFKDVAEALQIGVASSGAHAGRIAFPLYDKNGTFLAYASATQVKLPKHWKRA